MRISDWSVDVCSSDLNHVMARVAVTRDSSITRPAESSVLSRQRVLLIPVGSLSLVNRLWSSLRIRVRRPASYSKPIMKRVLEPDDGESEERCVGEAVVMTCRLWCAPYL